MYERMLDKKNEPSLKQIKAYVGEESYASLCAFEEQLKTQYQLSKELRFPFGNNYGWGYKYSHKSVHLCYAFFEEGAFTIMVHVGDQRVPALEKEMDALSPKARELWAHRYPCGEIGGWVQVRVLEYDDLCDALKFINAKKAPKPIKA